MNLLYWRRFKTENSSNEQYETCLFPIRVRVYPIIEFIWVRFVKLEALFYTFTVSSGKSGRNNARNFYKKYPRSIIIRSRLLHFLDEIVLADAISCKKSFQYTSKIDKEAGVATFDLSSLKMRANGWYTFRDELTVSNRNYSYALNVCGRAHRPSETLCQNEDPLATAYQFDSTNNGGECFRLGSTFDDDNAEWSLIDPLAPTKGVKLKYKGGTHCGPPNNKDRSITITFPCYNRDTMADSSFLLDSRVREKDCDYFLNFHPTPSACPLGCTKSSGDTVFIHDVFSSSPRALLKETRQSIMFENAGLDAVCGNNGFCGYDSDRDRFACFCDNGWYGESCEMQGAATTEASSASAPGCDGVCVALIFVFLLLLGLIATAIVILFRVRKMNEMNIRFAALAEDLNPDGEEAFELQDATRDDDDDVDIDG
eukprot:jgi/Bigna1/130049/aug1.10_g4757